MKLWVICLAVCLSLLGCKTSTIESRRAERRAAYDSLTPEMKELVDMGQIKVGMPQDAVYISWGPPSEVLTSETEHGRTVTWLYHGTYLEETRYWAFREVFRDDRILLERFLEKDYNPRNYVQAEITFENGKVKKWRTLAKPLEKATY